MLKRYKMIADILLVFICAVAVLVIGIAVYMGDGGFSEEENRILSDFPRVNLENIADGRFFEGLSDFYSDRIPARRFMIRTKAVCELATGKSQNNGVLFLDGGRLADRGEYKSGEQLEKNLSAARRFLENGAVLAVVPRSADVYFGGEESERITQSVYSALGGEELFDRLLRSAREGRDVYYSTDHHLNACGAFILYEYVVGALGVTPYAESEFSKQTVSRDFLGSAYSSSGLLPVSYDEVVLYRYGGDGEFLVSCEDRGCELDSLYCFHELEGKDDYRIFTGGNHGVIHIKSCDGATDKPRVLVIKDSFANAVIPLLSRHFDLTVVDPRYAESFDFEGYDATVLIFGIDTFATGAVLK